MENVAEKLMTRLNNLTEIEVIEQRIKVAILERKIEDRVKNCTQEIELRLDEEIKFYGQNPSNYQDYKNLIREKYEAEFKKIAHEYELQFINICEELQETEANQKIAIANCKKLKNIKTDYLNSDKYDKYKELKIKYQKQLDSSENKEEMAKNMDLLKNLKNPIDDYDAKIKANIVRVREYEEIIQTCIQKIDECISEFVESINDFVTKKTSGLQIYSQKNYFFKIIDKISALISGKKRLQMYVIDSADKEIEELIEISKNVQENVKEKTISFIEHILQYKEKLKENYNKIIENA